jgi:hypothetical protein
VAAGSHRSSKRSLRPAQGQFIEGKPFQPNNLGLIRPLADKKFKPFAIAAWGTGIEECWNDGMVGESNIPIFQNSNTEA